MASDPVQLLLDAFNSGMVLLESDLEDDFQKEELPTQTPASISATRRVQKSVLEVFLAPRLCTAVFGHGLTPEEPFDILAGFILLLKKDQDKVLDAVPTLKPSLLWLSPPCDN